MPKVDGQTTLAMWSGPRNISTAMMRSWENRADCQVVDEPFYAAYLQDTGLDHPMLKEILQHHETDWQQVIKQCLSPTAKGESVFYQKHMSHHMLPQYSRDWLLHVDHCFLLRNPNDVLKSYTKKREQVELADIGVAEQLELFNWLVQNSQSVPLIIDSADFLLKPAAYLRAICQAIDIPFDNNMLHWPAGPRDSDGIWASHWYNQVWQSTEFNSPQQQAQGNLTSSSVAGSVTAATSSSVELLEAPLQSVLFEAMPIYNELFAQRLVL